MRARAWALLAATVLLAGCREEVETVHTGFRGEARSNPLLAAQRTLDRLGVTSRVQYGLSVLPAEGEVLLTAEGALAIEGPILTSFLDWVDAGGRAVVCLDGFALPTGTPGLADDEDFFFIEEEPAPWLGRRSALLEELGLERIEGDEYWSGILGFDAELRVEDGLILGVDGEDSAIEVEHGDGDLTILASGHIFNNQNLGHEEHAKLLYELVSESRPSGALVIAYVKTPGLWGLLTGRAPFALWSALALLVVWLWRSWPRFGPVEDLDSLGSAGFRTHVAAVGRFLWKHDRGPTLLAKARKRALADVRARFPGGEGLDPEALCRAVSERTGLGAGEVERALFDAGPLRPDDFVAVQRALTRLRGQS